MFRTCQSSSGHSRSLLYSVMCVNTSQNLETSVPNVARSLAAEAVEGSEIATKEVFGRVEQVWLFTKTFSDSPSPNGIPNTLGCYGNTISLQWFSSFFFFFWSLLARSCEITSLMHCFFNTFIQRRFVLVDSSENGLFNFVKSKERRKTESWKHFRSELTVYFLRFWVVYSFHLCRGYLPFSFNCSVKFCHFPVTTAAMCICYSYRSVSPNLSPNLPQSGDSSNGMQRTES